MHRLTRKSLCVCVSAAWSFSGGLHPRQPGAERPGCCVRHRQSGSRTPATRMYRANVTWLKVRGRLNVAPMRDCWTSRFPPDVGPPAGICSHSEQRALVRFDTDVGGSGRSSQSSPSTPNWVNLLYVAALCSGASSRKAQTHKQRNLKW